MYMYVFYVYDYMSIYVCTPPCLLILCHTSFSCLRLSGRGRSFTDKSAFCT